MKQTYVIYFAVWIITLFIINCLLARRVKRFNLKRLSVYIITVALAGVYGEILLGTFYNAVFGHPLWEYRIYPIHHAYTSYFSLVIWSMYGFHLYLLHDTLRRHKITKVRYLALIFAAEAIIFEMLVNLTFLAAYGQYIFYYFPSDLWHLSSIKVIPFYLVGGVMIIKTINHFKADPKFFAFITALLLTAVIVTA